MPAEWFSSSGEAASLMVLICVLKKMGLFSINFEALLSFVEPLIEFVSMYKEEPLDILLTNSAVPSSASGELETYPPNETLGNLIFFGRFEVRSDLG